MKDANDNDKKFKEDCIPLNMNNICEVEFSKKVGTVLLHTFNTNLQIDFQPKNIPKLLLSFSDFEH